MKIFLICPVRNQTGEQGQKIRSYIEEQRSLGHEVYYPFEDTEQNDPLLGFGIITQNTRAIRNADEVHIWWDKTSKGSLFDLGAAFALHKPLVIANIEDVEPTTFKSFENVICEWSFQDW